MPSAKVGWFEAGSSCKSEGVSRRILAITSLWALLAVLGGCAGEGDESTDSTATASEASATQSELPAKLPGGWTREVNRSAGFTVGLPTGWRAARRGRGNGTVLRSPDDLVAVTVTADRTRGALGLDLGEFANRTLEALGGRSVGTERFDADSTDEPPAVRHPYESAVRSAVGTSRRTGVRERVIVAVLRREGLATFVVVVRENAERDSAYAGPSTVRRLIRSVRDRVPG